MIGITGQQFLDNSMNWNSDKLAILFMAGYERPSYDPNINHFQLRMNNAIKWYQFMQGYIPPEPSPTSRKAKRWYIAYNKKIRIIK